MELSPGYAAAIIPTPPTSHDQSEAGWCERSLSMSQLGIQNFLDIWFNTGSGFQLR